MTTTAERAPLDDELARLFASDADMVANPYPLYRRLVDEHPVHDLGPFVVASGYETIRMILLDPDRMSSAVQREGSSRVELARDALANDEHKRMFDEVVGIERQYLTQTDSEAHDRLRDVSRKLFTPRRIAALAERTQELADDLFDALLEEGPCMDFAQFSYQLPALVTAELLGVPHEDAPRLIEWGDMIMSNMFGGQGTDALEAAHEAHRRYDAYVADIISDHRSGRTPTELVAALLGATGREILDDDQLSALFREQVLGGFETTRVALVGTCLELLRRPDQWRLLREDPSLAANVFEEGLRFTTPVQWSARIPLVDVEIEGLAVPADKTCLVMLGAANRDGAVFQAPDNFDLTRANAKQHLAFAVGKHYCLGQALARLEGRIAFAMLATRFPEAELAIDPADVEFTGQAVFRRVAALPIRLNREKRG